MSTNFASTNTTPSPVGGAVSVGLTNQLCVPPNPGRNGLWLWNNSATGSISLCPAQQWTIAAGTAPAAANATTLPVGAVSAVAQGVPGTNSPGSVTLSPGQWVLIDSMNLAGAWNGLSTGAPSNVGSLTVLEGT